MIETIGFCNQKGGVGKTTSAINLAASLAVAEKKVLLVDFDPQCNTSTGLGIQKNSIKSNSYELLTNPETVVPTKTMLPFLDLIPSTTDLVGAEVELVGEGDRNRRLKSSLQLFQGEYDFIFVDSPPSLGLLTINLLVASTALIIPVQCEFYALEGLSDLLRTIDAVKAELNPHLKIGGILLTMYDQRNKLSHDVETEIRTHFASQVFQTVIPRGVRISEAPSHGVPIILYDVKSRGSESYLQLAREFLERFSGSRVDERGGEKENLWQEKGWDAGLRP